MVYRLEIKKVPPPRTLQFEGLLDRKALDEILAFSRPGPGDRLVLRAGSEVSPECIAALLEVSFEVVAESAYLARWLEQARRAGGRS